MGTARVLVVLPLVPYPPDQGDRLRAWDLVQDLAGLGQLHALVVGPWVPGAPAAALHALGATVVHLPLGRGELLRGALAQAVRGRPAAVGAFWSPRARTALAAVAPGPWDLVVAFQLRAAWYAVAVPARLRLLELTDSLSLYAARLPARGRALRQRLGLLGAPRLERDWPRRFDLTVVSAPEDAAVVARLSGVRPAVVPNGCRAAAAPAPWRPGGPLLFVGNMRYPPNEDAILWFARTIWPVLWRAWPDLRLRVAGRPTRRVAQLARTPGVEVLGFVPDLAAEWAAALALINPMRFGSGTNRKVLDGLAAGRPVVSTRLGARGVTAGEGEGLLRADAPGEWLQAVAMLRAADGRGEALGRAAWNWARRWETVAAHGWSALLHPLLTGAGG
jgi:glycosyltransferase involved in cell wall biosynthesis